MYYYKEETNFVREEIIKVFKSVGWGKNPDDIVEAFKNSYVVCCYTEDSNLVGFARAISDSIYYTNIFDVVVMPEHQKNGIGKEMMKMLLEKFKGTYFFLTHTEGKREFYEKCGFIFNDCGMWIPK